MDSTFTVNDKDVAFLKGQREDLSSFYTSDRIIKVDSFQGLEVYYPAHKPEQTAMFLEYAQRHNLLMSSGSDSHSPEKPPIKYPAELSRTLLERLGIQIVH